MTLRPVAYCAALVLVVAYSWLATGVTPFHSLSYVVIAIPTLLVLGLYVFVGTSAERQPGVSMSRVAPWIAVLASAVILESVGLILGGHSSRVPTLSTLVDHVLSAHWLRCVLFLLWLVVGVAPLRRVSQRRREALTQ